MIGGVDHTEYCRRRMTAEVDRAAIRRVIGIKPKKRDLMTVGGQWIYLDEDFEGELTEGTPSDKTSVPVSSLSHVSPPVVPQPSTEEEVEEVSNLFNPARIETRDWCDGPLVLYDEKPHGFPEPKVSAEDVAILSTERSRGQRWRAFLVEPVVRPSRQVAPPLQGVQVRLLLLLRHRHEYRVLYLRPVLHVVVSSDNMPRTAA